MLVSDPASQLSMTVDQDAISQGLSRGAGIGCNHTASNRIRGSPNSDTRLLALPATGLSCVLQGFPESLARVSRKPAWTRMQSGNGKSYSFWKRRHDQSPVRTTPRPTMRGGRAVVASGRGSAAPLSKRIGCDHHQSHLLELTLFPCCPGSLGHCQPP